MFILNTSSYTLSETPSTTPSRDTSNEQPHVSHTLVFGTIYVAATTEDTEHKACLLAAPVLGFFGLGLYRSLLAKHKRTFAPSSNIGHLAWSFPCPGFLCTFGLFGNGNRHLPTCVLHVDGG